jgi:hypothetical protein
MSLKLTKIEAGVYETEDGRYRVERSEHLTYCLDPHPVKVGADERAKIREALAEHGGRAFDVIRFGRTGSISDAIHAVADGQRGYHCPGDEEHVRNHWIVWDNETDDYARKHGSDGDDFESKKEAVEWMEKYCYGDPYAEMREAMRGV